MSHNIVKQLTLRGIPGDVYRDLEREARRQGTSLNKALLKKILPETKKREGASADLLRLAGTWDEKRGADFDSQMERHRTIDPDLWS